LATFFQLSCAICLLLAATMTSGCDRNAAIQKEAGIRVSGKVLLPNGNPLTGGTLILRPESGLFGAVGQIQPDGSFKLQDAQQQEIQPGRYQVFVRFSDPSLTVLQRLVHPRYQQSSEDGESDLVIDISSDNDNLIIRLNR
jgi:hypothetical protein